MIVLVSKENKQAFLAYENHDVFSCRIVSDYRIFGMDKTSYLFYIQSINGRITAVLSKINGIVTVSACADADLEEIYEFIEVTGSVTVLCDKKIASFASGRDGDVLLYSGASVRTDVRAEEGDAETLHEVYPLLCKCFDSIPPFDIWYTDMSHRIRHEGAGFVTVKTGTAPVSCGFSLFHTPYAMIISGVCTQKEHRFSGYASACVKKLVELYTSKNIYVFTEHATMTKWYENLGFTICGKWCEGKKEG